MKSIIVIPALNPPEQFVSYVDELIASGAEHLLLVDDGSSQKRRPFLRPWRSIPSVRY
ncbi:MAG: hypothetical protein V8Q27_09915 [Eubacteriales bacterium]